MILSLILGSVCFGPRLSRAESIARLEKLSSGDPTSKVVSLLGQPDRIDRRSPKGRAYYRYGTSGPGTLATLGSVAFESGRIVIIEGQGEPPTSGVIEETALRKSLQRLNDVQEYGCASEIDPLRLIRSANLLIRLGQSRAIEVMHEYERIGCDAKPLRFLLRAIFDVPGPGFFPEDVLIRELIEVDRKSNPRWPIFISGGIVFQYPMGWGGAGNIGSIRFALKPLSASSKFTASIFEPTNDPFHACLELVGASTFPVPEKDKGEAFSEFAHQTLRLVRNVYRPKNFVWSKKITPKEFEGYRQDFLKLGANWDSTKQTFVIPKSKAAKGVNGR